MSDVAKIIKRNFISDKCVECGSIYGELQFWNSGGGHFTDMYICATCRRKFIHSNQT